MKRRSPQNTIFRWTVIGLLFSVVALWGQGFSPNEAVPHMTLPEDLQVKLVAAEPMISQPVCIEFDDRGRLWAMQYIQYPNPAGLKRAAVDRWSRTTYDRIPDPPPNWMDSVTVILTSNVMTPNAKRS